jgi:hypothetical protein
MTRPEDIASVHGPRPGVERVLGRYGDRDTSVALAVAPGGAALVRSSAPYMAGGIAPAPIPHIDDPLPRPPIIELAPEPKPKAPKVAKTKTDPFTPARSQSQIEARLNNQNAVLAAAEERYRQHLIDEESGD